LPYLVLSTQTSADTHTRNESFRMSPWIHNFVMASKWVLKH
jgi:hypothetical protein